ncbi:solute carrier organic anion transporter family member 4A1 [Talpa occidentalis]|uniref:solute carrier organic anion transporter family member 4A1 n=1 Tax=Talpa occidentalis TaxID=50954 RepID=UPI00189033F7|nr:solute carrier organic anion transporter family member 4A1 [Talpa occidentalis]
MNEARGPSRGGERGAAPADETTGVDRDHEALTSVAVEEPVSASGEGAPLARLRSPRPLLTPASRYLSVSAAGETPVWPRGKGALEQSGQGLGSGIRGAVSAPLECGVRGARRQDSGQQAPLLLSTLQSEARVSTWRNRPAAHAAAPDPGGQHSQTRPPGASPGAAWPGPPLPACPSPDQRPPRRSTRLGHCAGGGRSGRPGQVSRGRRACGPGTAPPSPALRAWPPSAALPAASPSASPRRARCRVGVQALGGGQRAARRMRGRRYGHSPELLLTELTRGTAGTTIAVASAEMPQHPVGARPPAAPAAPARPGRGPSLLHPPPAPGGPLGARGQLCEPRPGRRGWRGAREARWVAVRPRSSPSGRCAPAPACLRALNSPGGVLGILCGASFLQGMTVNGLVSTVVTSLERRFDLPSTQSGLIASAYDAAACLCLPVVSHLGGRGHKPRWLGAGVLLMGAGALLFALPHFAAGPYEVPGGQAAGTCWANRSWACGAGAPGLQGYQLVFVLGQLLQGAGATPLYTLGVTYLDENVQPSLSPVYIATFYTAAILGPAAGYLIGGALLDMYTDLGRRTELTSESPLWVGAWWVGFLGAGAAAFLVAIPLLGSPRQLPGSQRHEARQLQASGRGPAGSPRFRSAVRELPVAAGLLLRNPAFVLLCLAAAAEATLVAGMSTFGPKFLESQLGLSAPQAASLFGYMVVPAGGGGTLLGGILVNKLKLRGSGMVKLCLLGTLASLLATLVFFTHCPNVPVAGVTASYGGRPLPSGHPELTAACNAACRCPPELYSPVCGSDGLTYYSPCHAGCPGTTASSPGGQKVYLGCRCVPQNLSSGLGNATAGKCASACPGKPLLLAFMVVLILFTFLGSVPALTATLRCVCGPQRSLALGVQWIVVRALGSIPGPVAFGWVIDRACLLWQHQCDRQGSCLAFQNAAMSRAMLVAGLAYKVLGLLFFAAACFLYRSPPGCPDGPEASLPCRAAAPNSPAGLQLQSNV